MSRRVVAIDGPAGSGKSTVARALAQALGWSYLDTGAMYRAVTVAALERGVDPGDEAVVADLARRVEIATIPRVTLEGRDVEEAIRTPEVNVAVSTVAALPAVRAAMVERQRRWAEEQPAGTVVEGRDITTVVFPAATVKVFLTASPEERQRRRGEESPESLLRRDEADAARAASPLRQAPDALVVDTTGRAVEDVVEEIRECLSQRLSN
jgi:cytidylate kinase